MKGKALIRPGLDLCAAKLCIVMDAASLSSAAEVEIMKEEKREPAPVLQLAGLSWRYTCVVQDCPEQLPQAMFQCNAVGCTTAPS